MHAESTAMFCTNGINVGGNSGVTCQLGKVLVKLLSTQCFSVFHANPLITVHDAILPLHARPSLCKVTKVSMILGVDYDTARSLREIRDSTVTSNEQLIIQIASTEYRVRRG